MLETITFNKNGNAMGRNGRMKVTAVEVMINDWSPEQVVITPVNTKGVGNCYITIPIEHAAHLADLLAAAAIKHTNIINPQL